MRDWLTIQFEKGDDSCLEEFIQANPGMDDTMRTLLANYLNMSEPNLQKWIEEYQLNASEFLQSFINHTKCAHWSKGLPYIKMAASRVEADKPLSKNRLSFMI